MQYEAILLEQKRTYIVNDDVILTYVLRNSNGVLITSLTGWTFTAKLASNMDEISLAWEAGLGHITVSGAKIEVHLPADETVNIEDNIKYRLELQGILSSKTYTLSQDEIWFKDRV